MKVEIVGWPVDIPFVSAHNMSKTDLGSIFDKLRDGTIKFVITDENTRPDDADE
jgi:hypothetical protein